MRGKGGEGLGHDTLALPLARDSLGRLVDRIVRGGGITREGGVVRGGGTYTRGGGRRGRGAGGRVTSHIARSEDGYRIDLHCGGRRVW